MQLRPLLWVLAAALTLSNAALAQKANRGPGDILWQETFDATTWSNTVVDDATVIENLPAGWTFSDQTSNGFYWQWSQQGPRGRYTSPNGGSVPRDQLTPATAITSTTGANGFLLMPSDWYNTNPDGTPVTPAVAMDSYVEFGPVDVSSIPEVHFRMEYFFKLLKPENAQILVTFRDANQNSFSYDFEYEENIPTANTEIFDLNVSDSIEINGLDAQQVFVRIAQIGSSHYFFMIDDISLYQPLDRDLRITNNWLDYHVAGGQNQDIDITKDYFGGYKTIPLMVVDTFAQFRTRVQNFGGIVREDVYSHLVIANYTIPQINPVYEHVSDSGDINPSGFGDFVNSVPFKPKQYGIYGFTATVTDGLPEDTDFNSFYRTIHFTQTLYSYVDTMATGSFQAMQADTTTVNIGNGQLFWIPDIGSNTVQFQNMGFYIHTSQNVNHLNAQVIEVTGHLYRKNGVVYELIQSTAPYKPVASDRGTFVTLPFENPQELTGNRDYYLILKTTGQTVSQRLMLASDPNHQQSYGRSGIILGAGNNLIVVDKTPVFYTRVTGGIIPEETDILAFNITGQVGSTNINDEEKTIDLTMPSGTDVTALIPEYVLSVNATAEIGGIGQLSGVTLVDFTNPVTYTITNGTNSTDWSVSVSLLPEPDTDFLSFTIKGQTDQTTIDTDNHTISLTMPFGQVVKALVPTFTISEGATVEVGGVAQASGITANDFTTPVTYTVTNGIVSQDWTVTVFLAPEPEFLSFSINGQIDQTIIDTDNNTISLTMPSEQDVTALIATFTVTDGATVEVSGVAQESGITANNFTTPVTYTITNGLISNNWVVTVLEGPEPIIPAFNSFSLPQQVEQDVDPINRTIFIKTRATNLTSLIATFTLNVPTAKAFIGDVEQISAVTPANFTTPVVYRLEDGPLTSEWTVTVSNILQTGNDILTFAAPGQLIESSIDAINHEILSVVSDETQVNPMIPYFQLSSGATAFIGTTEQISDETPVNFTNPVIYTIVSESGESQEWLVRVVKYSTLQSGAEILAFGFSGQTQPAVINPDARTINVNLSPNLNITSLIPVFVLSPGAKAYKGNTQITSGGNILNFTNSTVFRIRAENLFDMKDWTITVTNNQSTLAAFETFKLEFDYNQDTVVDTTFHGTIYNSNSKIEIHLPEGTRLDSLKPIWTVSPGASVKIDTVDQISGVTYVDLSSSVNFTVLAQDGNTSRVWTLYTYADIVGIQNHEIYSSVRIYPNPATSSIQVSVPEEMRNGKYQIYNIFGQTVHSEKYKGVAFDIEIETLPRGIYFVKINSDRYQVIEKMMFR